MMKKLMAAALGILVVTGVCTNIYAAEWKRDNLGWWFQNDDGSYPSQTWSWLDGNSDGVAECYYFNEQGYLLTGTSTPDGYKVNDEGAWTENDQVQTKKSGEVTVEITASEVQKKATTAVTRAYLARLYREENAKGAAIEVNRSYYPSMQGEWLAYIFWDAYEDSGYPFTAKKEELFFKDHKGAEGRRMATSVKMSEFSQFFDDTLNKTINITGLEKAIKSGIMAIGSARNSVAVNPNVVSDIDRVYKVDLNRYEMQGEVLKTDGKYEVHNHAGELVESGDIVSTFKKKDSSYFGFTWESTMVTPRFVK